MIVVEQMQDKERSHRKPAKHSVASPDTYVAGNASDVLPSLPQLKMRQGSRKVLAHTLQDSLQRVLLPLMRTR